MTTTIITRLPSNPIKVPVSSSKQDVAIGITLPITQDTVGIYFNQSYTTLEQAKTNIKNLILTMRGERIMHPTLGSNIYNLLQEPMRNFSEIQTIIDSVIREEVGVWLPYINIDSVTTEFDADRNFMKITIELSLKNDPTVKDILYIPISTGDR